jgi:hypothetical protein
MDRVVVGVILFASLGLLATAAWGPVRPPAALVRIVQDHQPVREIKLTQDQRLAIPGMEIEISHGAVRVAKSDCPRGLCQHAGWISRSGSTIVCVPNHVLIEIVGQNCQSDYDAVTY